MILTVPITIFLIDYLTHISSCKDEDLPYGYGSFKDFIREFNKYNNWITNSHRGDFFSEDYEKYYICANIIIFDGKVMILYPISYFKFEIWNLKKWKEMKGIKRISWRENKCSLK